MYKGSISKLLLLCGMSLNESVHYVIVEIICMLYFSVSMLGLIFEKEVPCFSQWEGSLRQSSGDCETKEESMADVDSGSLPVIAVTAAVGAIVLLLGLFCSVIKSRDKEEREGNVQFANEPGYHAWAMMWCTQLRAWQWWCWLQHQHRSDRFLFPEHCDAELINKTGLSLTV